MKNFLVFLELALIFGISTMENVDSTEIGSYSWINSFWLEKDIELCNNPISSETNIPTSLSAKSDLKCFLTSKDCSDITFGILTAFYLKCDRTSRMVDLLHPANVEGLTLPVIPGLRVVYHRRYDRSTGVFRINAQGV